MPDNITIDALDPSFNYLWADVDNMSTTGRLSHFNVESLNNTKRNNFSKFEDELVSI